MTSERRSQPPSKDRPAELSALNRITAGGRRVKKTPAPEAAQWGGGRDPRLIGDLVEEVVTQHGWQRHISVADLVVRWEVVVGQVNAQHCRPAGFDDGLLIIQADSSSWATAIGLGLTAIQQKIDQEFGPGLVTGIKVRGPAGPPGAKGRWRVKNPK
ncbi:MAG: DUF721 domain-containing protein [Micrococcales bacterium]|nr:DUF721 domain-containing protein [Micrococcales bacterium]